MEIETRAGTSLAACTPNRIAFQRSDRLNVAYKPEATALQCPNVKLICSVIAEHSPGAIDATGERSFRDGPAIPDRVDQLIFADNPIMVAHQMNNEIEDLRLDVDGCALTSQFVQAKVDLEIRKSVFHYQLD